MPIQKDEDESNGESPEEELDRLQKPLIRTTGRERKSVELYADKRIEKDKTLDYSKGKGIKLREIPVIKHNIDKADMEDLYILHRIMYGKKGEQRNLKKNLLDFSGWPFDKTSKKYNLVRWNIIDRFFIMPLRWTLKLLGLDGSGKDAETMRNVLCEFLLEPSQNDELPGGEDDEKEKLEKQAANATPEVRSKENSSGKARGRPKKSLSTPNSDPKDKSKDCKENIENGKRRGRPKKSESTPKSEIKDKSEGSKEDKENNRPRGRPKKVNLLQNTNLKDSKEDKENSYISDVSMASDDSESGSEEYGEKEKMEKKTSEDIQSSKTENVALIKMSWPASSKRKLKASSASSEDEEPLVKKSKLPPTDVELKKAISFLLKDADLQVVTLNSVVGQIYEKYSAFDLSLRKNYIKETIKGLMDIREVFKN